MGTERQRQYRKPKTHTHNTESHKEKKAETIQDGTEREREMAKIKKSIATEKDRHTTARDGTKRKTF